MKIMAPVNSYESCVAQIQAGTDEIYLSYRIDFFKRFHFSGRYQMSMDGKYLAPDRNEFKKIVRYAQDHQVSVNLTANHGSFSDYKVGNIDFEKAYIEYIYYAVECGIKNIIVADIGQIYLINKKNLPINLHASATLDTSNLAQIKLLSELGVKRVVLSYETDLEEIAILKRKCNIEIEVFGYGGCSFSSYCMLGHAIRHGIPCKCKYYTNNKQNEIPFLDSLRSCAICSLFALQQLNVDAVKIAGREFHHKRIAPMTIFFSKAVKMATDCQSEEEYKQAVREITPQWWKKAMCQTNQCKYQSSFQQNYRIY